MNGIRLLTRADDAGMNTTANQAIRAAARQGIVRNVSILACGPAVKDAVEVLGDLAGTVDFGFHVCLTAEWENLRWGPVSEKASVASILRADGTLPFTCEELAGLSPDPDHMMAEIGAQYEYLCSLGITPSYLDEHMGVGAAVGLTDRLEQFARERGLVYNRRLIVLGAVKPVPGWNGPAEHPGTELADALAEAGPGTYLVVGHPAFKTPEMGRAHLPGHPTGEAMIQRNRERRMFADIEIVDYCDNVEVELLRYASFA